MELDEFDNEYLICLKKDFYDPLYELVKKDKAGSITEKQKSLFLAIKKLTPTARFSCLDGSARKLSECSVSAIEYLQSHHLIRQGNDTDKYCITAQGIWEIDERLDNISLTKLLEYFEDDWCPKAGKFDDKKKVLILSLISLRSFSQDCALVRNNPSRRENSTKVMIKVADFLYQQGYIKSQNVFPNPKRIEEKGSALICRVVSLQDDSRGIYKFDYNSRYWLDLYDDNSGNFRNDRLAYLLWKIFGGKLTEDKRDLIASFCRNIILEFKNLIYDGELGEKFIFFESKYNNVISDALFSILDYSALWQKEDGL